MSTTFRDLLSEPSNMMQKSDESSVIDDRDIWKTRRPVFLLKAVIQAVLCILRPRHATGYASRKPKDDLLLLISISAIKIAIEILIFRHLF